MKYEERTYRNLIFKDNLKSCNVAIAESDLFISSDIDLSTQAKKSLLHHRSLLENYIKKHPQFLTALLPLPGDDLAPAIVRQGEERLQLARFGELVQELEESNNLVVL